ncbi:MAG TPA: class I SAM-dependent methyltransferase [Candidatus Dormibacteraeota bacterium]|nr:class I SAM-dependent methyltransferase [Candidatus Dormibacteraeota bacterium]
MGQPRDWNKQAESWDSGIHSQEWPHYHYYHTFGMLLEGLIRESRRVLELGCGTGDATLNCAHFAEEIVASDSSHGMIHLAKGKLRVSPNMARVHLVMADAQYIPARSSTFDAAFSRGALVNYVPNPTRMLSEVSRALVPSGKLILDMITRKPGGEAKLYSPTQVENMLKDTGFSEIAFRPIGMFTNLWRDRELMDFANKHRDTFCRIEIAMNNAFKLDQSPMMIVTASNNNHPV